MTSDEDVASRAKELIESAGRSRLDSDTMQQWTVKVAEAVAASQERLAVTFDRLANQRPDDAGRLRTQSETARKYAAREREWAEAHRR